MPGKDGGKAKPLKAAKKARARPLPDTRPPLLWAAISR